MHREESLEALTDLATSPPATFKGRLELDSFKYSAPAQTTASSLHRRNPRRTAASSSGQDTSAVSAASLRASPGSVERTNKGKRVRRPSSPLAAHTPEPPTTRQGKRMRTARGYAPPSTYAHLPLLPDTVAPNLLVLFIGLNPGIQTARTGHSYAHPSNLFWKLLFSSGITPRPCRADEDRHMPALYSLGQTNIVARPSRNGAELSKAEMDDGVALLEEKARRWRPEAMCVVGKGIWESIWRVRRGRPVGRDFRYGWQHEADNMGVIDGEWPGARIFVATSTSGLAASLSPTEKQAIWAQLGSWVKARRAEREMQAETDRRKDD
ncbi:hypothetical protein G6O67_008415 [Ophiocordyceps sinensis]|uniref:Uracil-DNA glycosylase-like domain-containing protein n=1 Tax=Ophiocordyceps sinensis TaxID=72228 RepID=A0A8H4LRX5_9HYPO|nr:hypothetical protein G6O67_008415 [Ophiocordyceps sinensis]